MTVPVDVSVSADSVKINIETHADAKNATLYILSMKSAEEVEIPRGENAGKTLWLGNARPSSKYLES